MKLVKITEGAHPRPLREARRRGNAQSTITPDYDTMEQISFNILKTSSWRQKRRWVV